MFRNYLKIAWRNLRKNRTYALINVTGLALGMGCALLIFALVRYHFATDTHHRNYDRTYQFTSRFTSPNGDFNTRVFRIRSARRSATITLVLNA